MGYYLRELVNLRKDFTDSYNEKRYADAIDIGNKITELYKNNNACNTESYADDINNLAIVFDDVHIYDRAKELYKEAAGIKKELLGENSMSYLNTLTNFGVLLSSSGDFSKAEEVLKTVSGRIKENEGEHSVKYADSLYNLGNMYADWGKTEKAVEILTNTLEIAKNIKNYEMSDFLDIHVSLADAGRKYGNYRRARDEYGRAAKISEKINEADSYFKMTYLLNSALVCQKAERFEDAAKQYEQAVAVRERLMDTKHLDFISVLNNLALMYNLNKEHEKALDVHKRVLSLVEEMLGKNHVFYGDVITNIGVDYCALGDLEKAIEYHNEALEMKEKLVGENHPHYILTLISLAEIYEKSEKYDRAIELQEKALELKRKNMGEISEPVGESLIALGRLYMKKGDNLRAQGFFMQSLIMNKDIIITGGIKVRGYAENIRLMAEACCNMGESDKTVRFCEKLIEYRESEYGKRHPKYAKALYDSAELLIKLDLYVKAEEYLQSAEEIAETMIGMDTPFFIRCICTHCKVLYKMKKYEQAADKLKKAVSLHKKYSSDNTEFLKLMFMQAKTQYILGYKQKAEEIIFRAEGIASRSDGIDKAVIAAEKADFASELVSGGDSEKAVDIFEKIYDDLDKENKRVMYNVTLKWAEAEKILGKNENAADLAVKALEYAKNTGEKCEAEILAAKAMTALNRAKEAGERLEKLLPSISEESSDFIKYASEVYCLLGAAFENEPEKSTDYFEKGLAEAKARENIPTEEYCDFLKKASETAAKLNKYTKATEYLSETALIVRRDYGENTEFADILAKAGELYMLQERYADAVTMYDKAAELYAGLFGKEDEKYCDMVINSCNALIKDEKYNEAARRLENADSFCGREEEFKRLLTSAYKSMGAFGKLVKLKMAKNMGKSKK